MPLVHPQRGITGAFVPVAAVRVQAPEFRKRWNKPAGDFFALVDRDVIEHVASNLARNRLWRCPGKAVKIVARPPVHDAVVFSAGERPNNAAPRPRWDEDK